MKENNFKIDIKHISITAEKLHARINERFPESGLSRLAKTIHLIVDDTNERILKLKKPSFFHRSIRYSLIALIVIILIYLILCALYAWKPLSLINLSNVFLFLDPFFSVLVCITAFVVFIWTLEFKDKHQQVLTYVNELRSLAHVIDMHQLTKDPERHLLKGPDTDSSPVRSLSYFELGRYLDYCSELWSIIGKIAALWAQAFPVPIVLNAVDQIELLTTGLSRKVWQKLSMLKDVVRDSKVS